MSRRQKYPDRQIVIDIFYNSVSDYYDCCRNHSSKQRGKTQQDIADEFGISRLKVRKILITTGDLRYPETEQIQKLIDQGRKMDQIELITGMKKSTINGFLPYSKGIYKLSEVSAAAERTALYRTRKEAVEELKEKISEDWSDSLWQAIIAFQNYPFKKYVKNGTNGAKVEKFSYSVVELKPEIIKKVNIDSYGDKMLIAGTDTKISRSTVESAIKSALKRMKGNGCVTSPRELKAPGAEEYLYSIFIRLGIIVSTK